MFGTASKAKHHLVVALGGIPIDYRTEDFGRLAAGVDAVLDPIGGRNWLRDRIAPSVRADGSSVMECQLRSREGAET